MPFQLTELQLKICNISKRLKLCYYFSLTTLDLNIKTSINNLERTEKHTESDD